MYNTIEELLKAYSDLEIEKVSDTLYYIAGTLFAINEVKGKFEFEVLE
jgi:hypothetical protein